MVAAVCTASAQPRPFTPADLWEWREIRDARINPDGDMAVYAERFADRASDTFQSRLWLAPADGSARRPLTSAGASDTEPRWSPDGSHVAFLSNRSGAPQIFTCSVKPGATPVQLTRGDATPLALAWSSDGRSIAYTARVAEPMPGATWAPPALLPQLRAPHTRLFVIPASGGDARAIPLGNLEPEGEPAWTPDGRSLLAALTAPFDPEHPLEGAEIYSLRLPDFTLRRITNHPGPDTNPVPSPDGSRIAWLSREPSPQSYVVAKLWVANPDGSRARALAGALDRDPVQPAWSSDSRTVYFLADDRGETRVWAARNDGSARIVLSAPRLRDFTLADSGRAVAVRAPEELVTFPVDVAGMPVVLAAPNRELLADRAMGPVEAFQYTAGTNTIQAWVTRPPGFDAARKHPLLLAVDDAPRRMCGSEFRLRSQVLAGAGMIVLCANPRGTPGYGEAFGNLIHTGLPGDDFDDWMAGVEAMASKPYVDPARLSIEGGLVAAWAIGHTARFHAAVARRPIVDFALDVAIASDGRQRASAWMGAMPWADPEQYWKHSPLYYAGQFRTPTLIVAGEHDAAADELYFALQARKVESALVRIGEERPGDLVLEMEAALAWLKR
jgi:dipeptidyl aminopeptidase/acylaminoacyl peptidase